MRLSGRDFEPTVVLAPDLSVRRPIRIGAGGLIYMLDRDEAIALATQLADAATQLTEQETQP